MDNKQNLKPELKEIYERVMNVPVKSSSPSQQTPNPQPPQQPIQQTQPIASVPIQENPITEVQPPTQPETNKTEEPFLSSVPPKPINSGNTPFIFSNKQKKIETTTTQETQKEPNKKNSKKSMLYVVISLFIFAYAIFWLNYFKVINFF